MPLSRSAKNIIYSKGKSTSHVPNQKSNQKSKKKTDNVDAYYLGKPNIMKEDGDFPRIRGKYA